MKASEEKIINESLDRSEQILQILEDTFGRDSKQARWSMKRYKQAIQGGSALGYRLAALYLEWCVSHPARVGNDTYSKPCKCDYGWIIEQSGRYRPCPRCLPGAHDRWTNDFNDAASLESESVF